MVWYHTFCSIAAWFVSQQVFAGNDVTSIIIVLPLVFYFNQRNKAFWTGVGQVTVALAGLLPLLAYLVIPRQSPSCTLGMSRCTLVFLSLRILVYPVIGGFPGASSYHLVYDLPFSTSVSNKVLLARTARALRYSVLLTPLNQRSASVLTRKVSSGQYNMESAVSTLQQRICCFCPPKRNMLSSYSQQEKGCIDNPQGKCHLYTPTRNLSSLHANKEFVVPTVEQGICQP